MLYLSLTAVYGALLSIMNTMNAQLSELYGNWASTVMIHAVGLIVLLPFAFTWALPFEGELAFVRWRSEDGGRMEGYINRTGEVVYQWLTLDDDAGYPIDQC